VEEAGSSKLTLSKENNRIYTTLKENKTKLETLKTLLKTQQDRYISQFTTLEETISELNTQSAYITGLSG
jgi:flagellar hook-associated protein 2